MTKANYCKFHRGCIFLQLTMRFAMHPKFHSLILYAFLHLCAFQRDCIQFAINAKPRQRFMPEDKSTISYKVWVLVESKPFEITIMVLIALNAIVLMMSVSDIVSEILNILC